MLNRIKNKLFPSKPSKPSNNYCEKGVLDYNEKYDPEIHKWGNSAYERCEEFYPGLYPPDLYEKQTSVGKPSNNYCEKGVLDYNEKYDPEIHKWGDSAYERCEKFYPGLYKQQTSGEPTSDKPISDEPTSGGKKSIKRKINKQRKTIKRKINKQRKTKKRRTYRKKN